MSRCRFTTHHWPAPSPTSSTRIGGRPSRVGAFDGGGSEGPRGGFSSESRPHGVDRDPVEPSQRRGRGSVQPRSDSQVTENPIRTTKPGSDQERRCHRPPQRHPIRHQRWRRSCKRDDPGGHVGVSGRSSRRIGRFRPGDCRDRPKDGRGEHRWRMGLPGHRQRPGSSHRNPGSAPYRSAETADPG